MVLVLSFQIALAQSAAPDVSEIIEVKEIQLSITPALGIKIMTDAKQLAAIII